MSNSRRPFQPPPRAAPRGRRGRRLAPAAATPPRATDAPRRPTAAAAKVSADGAVGRLLRHRRQRQAPDLRAQPRHGRRHAGDQRQPRLGLVVRRPTASASTSPSTAATSCSTRPPPTSCRGWSTATPRTTSSAGIASPARSSSSPPGPTAAPSPAPRASRTSRATGARSCSSPPPS